MIIDTEREHIGGGHALTQGYGCTSNEWVGHSSSHSVGGLCMAHNNSVHEEQSQAFVGI